LDRPIVYPGQIPLDTDVLASDRNAMIGIGYALQACLGTGTYVDGLACLPTVPASMQVTVGVGSLTTMSTIDASAYGTIAANLTPLVKMGINPFGSTSFTLTAPGTSGQSINYLIEAQLLEADGLPISLPYYNASNPSQPFTGPNNSQAQQNTVRTQRVGLQLKAGSPASAGTQLTPSVDAGWVGLYSITVNFAQTTITNTAISVYPSAPFIGTKIPGLAPLFSPSLTGSPLAPTAATGTATTQLATTAFVGNSIAPLATSTSVSNAFSAVRSFSNYGIAAYITNNSFTVPAGVFRMKVTCVGGGGSGAGCSSTTPGNSFSSGGGGGAGGLSWGSVNVTPGQVVPVVVGIGGTANAAIPTNPGNNGGSTSFLNISATGGGASNWDTVSSSGGGGGGAGSGTGNSVNFTGSGGSDGQAGGFIKSGAGGDGPWGGGGRAGTPNGSGAVSFGGGGGGAYNSTGGVAGSGYSGIVIIEY
jgi:hypothetical protein